MISHAEAIRRLETIEALGELSHAELYADPKNHVWNNVADNNNFVHGLQCGLHMAAKIARDGVE